MRCPSCGNLNRAEAQFCDSCGTRLEPAEPKAPLPGPSDAAPELIAGRYRVLDFLGRGGRKHVYRARDLEAGDREVAVAVLETEGIEETVLARARREAQAMGKLGEHPHVVRVLDSGEEGRVPYVVSEYVGGGDLAGTLERSDGRRLEIDRAVAVAIDVCRALEHAHSRGIVHRDLKPANVWLGEDGTARLGDFGLSTTDRRSRAAVEGMLVGTVAYLPPEQALGRGSDARSDLYSLGAMLYELLTGEPPFPGTNAVAIIGQHLNADPVAPSRHRPEIAQPLDRFVLGLLAKAPEARPQSAAEARRSLAAIAAGSEPDGPDPSSNPLAGLAGGVFVGRDDELEQMRTMLEDSLGGNGRLLLLTGDPGIGKTRTAEQLSTYARVRGARVYWGRCDEAEGAPPYWPWSEAIRGYVRDADPVGLRWQLGDRAADVARIVPELVDRLGDLGELGPLESEQARFRVFDSVAGFLGSASSARPMVLVLDDLHWADEPSLLLLRFLARRLAGTGLLLIGTYRDVELGRHHPLAETLGELAGVEGARRISLSGLGPEGIASYIELTAGVARPPRDLAEAIRDQTGGNPFFIGEVVRLMAAEGRLGEDAARAEVAIPQGVREVLGRRLDRQSPAANEVLRMAAICGREFRFEVLERISNLPSDQVEAALAEAVAARLLVEQDRGAGGYAFAHALVRETLLAEVPAARRAVVHLQIGEALEAVGDEREARVGELAHHFLEAGPAGDTAKAVDYATRAARWAASRLAHEEAAGLYSRALEALELSGPNHAEQRLELLLELGESQRRAASAREARPTFERAAALARGLERSEDLAQATLGICMLSEAGVVDDPLIELLNESLAAVGDGDSPLRSKLLSGLGAELYWVDPSGRSSALGFEALEMARRLGDDESLALALIRRQFTGFTGLAGSEESQRRLRESGELHDLAKGRGDLELELRAHLYRLRDRLELADIRGVDADLAAVERIAAELRQPNYDWQVPLLRGMRALVDGRFADAEILIGEARVGGERAQEPVAAMFYASQESQLRRLRRRPEDLVLMAESTVQLTDLLERYPAIPAWRCSLAATQIELGNRGEARALFEPLAANGFADLPFDGQWAVSLALLADVAVGLDDRPRCERLYELLLPLDGLTVVAGRAASCLGPVSRLLGALAIAIGWTENAERHLRDARALSDAMGDRPFGAWTRVQLASLLLSRGGDGDREQALELLASALDTAQEIGMVGLTEAALEARLETQGLTALDTTASIDFMIEAVSSERPDIAAYAAPDGQVTILFSDIEDSTLITERLGDRRWLEVLRAHNSVFRRTLPPYGGVEVKNQGDGFMLVFPDSARAVECAAAIQRTLADAELIEGERIRVRIGMHAGEAIREEGDYFGRSVIVAARIAAEARGGEILVSEQLKRRVEEDSSALGFDRGRELELKGLAGVHRIHRVDWERVAAS